MLVYSVSPLAKFYAKSGHVEYTQNFVPTKQSVVCELHFQLHDIERIQTVTDSQTGETYTAPLERPRLKKDAVLSQMPGCPTHLSVKVQSPFREFLVLTVICNVR